jgi:hypothetical protein
MFPLRHKKQRIQYESFFFALGKSGNIFRGIQVSCVVYILGSGVLEGIRWYTPYTRISVFGFMRILLRKFVLSWVYAN